jgi:putative endonuclease
MIYGGWVYILASGPYGTLYTGVTACLGRRLEQHRTGEGSAFCRKYKVHRLVWCERYDNIGFAIHREKRIKHWLRKWKINLIEATNPTWEDLTYLVREEADYVE